MPDHAATKLRHHPSSSYRPGLLLRQLLEVEEDLDSVHIVVKYKDKSMDIYRSETSNSDTCTAAVLMQDYAARAIKGGE